MVTPAPMGGMTAESAPDVLTLLSTASRVLASSLDYRAMMQRVCDLAVGPLARGCVIEVLEEDRILVVCAGDQETSELLPPSGLFTSVEKPESLQIRFHRLSGAHSENYLDVPIVTRQQLYGVLRLVGDGTIGDEPTRVGVAEEVALRIAVAVNSAHIQAREHRAADALQRALLPETLPSAPSFAYHAAYIPATAEAVVGGDWYDAFSLPDGRVAFSIGDVAGHGLRAAITMGEVRQALRASALDPRSPAAVLERANALMNMRENPVMVTAIFGIYEPATSIITYATAGHPGPVLGLRDGWTASLPTLGLPLGIGVDFESFDWTFTLPAGSLIAFFTDGLIEHRRDVIAGEASVVGAVASEALSPTGNPALSLQERVFGDDRNNDDVATLALTVADRAVAETIELTVSAIPLAAPLIRHALIDFAKRHGLAETTRFELVTTVGEAVANAAEHAYPESPGIVRVRVDREDDALRVSVEDQGRWKPTSRREERGRGLKLMRALSTGLQILSDANGTAIRMWIPIAFDEGVAV